MNDLALSGRELIYYDQLGCGNSPAPKDAYPWLPPLYVEELDNLREALGLKELHILGQSWGGMLAMEYALTRPRGVKSMIIASSLSSMPLWEAEAARLVKLLPLDMQAAIWRGIETRQYDTPEYQAAAQAFNLRHICSLDPPPDYIQYSNEHSGWLYEAMWGHDEYKVTGTLKDWDITDRLHEITLPVLITSGTLDESTPLQNKVIHDRIPNSEWELLVGTHCVHAEQPEAYNRLVEEYLCKQER
jgi:proline-specific peptidase